MSHSRYELRHKVKLSKTFHSPTCGCDLALSFQKIGCIRLLLTRSWRSLSFRAPAGIAGSWLPSRLRTSSLLKYISYNSTFWNKSVLVDIHNAQLCHQLNLFRGIICHFYFFYPKFYAQPLIDLIYTVQAFSKGYYCLGFMLFKTCLCS